MVIHFQAHLPDTYRYSAQATDPSRGFTPLRKPALDGDVFQGFRSSIQGAQTPIRFGFISREPSRDDRLVLVSSLPGYGIEPGRGNSDVSGGYKLTERAGGLLSALKNILDVEDLWLALRLKGSTMIPFGQTNQFAKLLNNVGSLPNQFDGLTINKAQDKLFYQFANGVLWFFMHGLEAMPITPKAWQAYEDVNDLFATEVIDKSGSDDVIWVHDYQFMLVPKMVREQRPNQRIGYFHHINFPDLEAFKKLPASYTSRLVKGLLGADLIGFHTERHVQHFFNALTYLSETGLLSDDIDILPDKKSVRLADREIRVGAFPISIDYDHVQNVARSLKAEAQQIRAEKYAGIDHLVVSAERLDPIKGIPNRLRGIELFLEQNPGYLGNTKFVLIAPPARLDIPVYQEEQKEVMSLIERINSKFRDQSGWEPIDYIPGKPHEELIPYYSMADAILTSSIEDGMNLVPKEGAVAQDPDDKPAAIVLSNSCGTAYEFQNNIPEDHAVYVNAMDPTSIASGIKEAVSMPNADKRERVLRLQAHIRNNTIGHWHQRYMQMWQAQIQGSLVG